MTSIGSSISRSIKLISQAATEIDSLSDLLKERFDEEILNESFEKYRSVADHSHWDGDTNTDENGWVYYDISYSIPLKLKGRKKAAGYLSFQISLCDEGHAAMDNQEPLFHVIWWKEPVEFEEGAYMGFPMGDEGDLLPELLNKRLFFWENEDNGIDEWTFSVFLTSLNTLNDITKKIIEPVTSLLNADNVEEALSCLEVEGLVSYQKVDGLAGQYQIINSPV